MPVFRKNGHCCTSFFLRSGHRRHPVLPLFRISEVPCFASFSAIRYVSFSRLSGHTAHSLSPFSGHLSAYFLPIIRTLRIFPRPNFYEKSVKIRTIRISGFCTLLSLRRTSSDQSALFLFGQDASTLERCPYFHAVIRLSITNATKMYFFSRSIVFNHNHRPCRWYAQAPLGMTRAEPIGSSKGLPIAQISRACP